MHPRAPRLQGVLLALAFLASATVARAERRPDVVGPEVGNPPVMLPDAPGAPLTVTIDVLPGDDSNVLVMGSDEGIPVAILSSGEFDAAAIETASLSLAGAPVATRAGQRPFALVLDVNADGLPDLLVQFTPRGVNPLGNGTVMLHGRTVSGQEFSGADVVTFVEPGGIEAVGLGRSTRSHEGPAPALRVFPNPARGPLGVALTLPGAEPATVELLDVSGRRIDRREIRASAGVVRSTFTWPEALAPGRYLVRVTQGARIVARPVSVLK